MAVKAAMEETMTMDPPPFCAARAQRSGAGGGVRGVGGGAAASRRRPCGRKGAERAGHGRLPFGSCVAASAHLLHDGDGVLGQEERGLDIDVEDLVPLFLGCFLHPCHVAVTTRF